jgi:hypothetical protein
MYLPGAIAVVLICPHCNPGKPRRQAKLFIFCQNVQFAQRSPFCSSAVCATCIFCPAVNFILHGALRANLHFSS